MYTTTRQNIGPFCPFQQHDSFFDAAFVGGLGLAQDVDLDVRTVSAGRSGLADMAE